MSTATRQKGAVAASTDWYKDASPEDRQEYDEFGPWIQEIRSERDMPPRFRPFFGGHLGARFLIKMPRDVERREVRPGQDLYRAVLAFDEERVSFLTLNDETVTETSLELSQIEAVVSSQNLLSGRMSFLTAHEESLFSYNTVSEPLIDSIVDFVRFRLAGVGYSLPVLPVLVQDYHYSWLAARLLRRREGVRVIFCEEPGRGWKSGGLLVLADSVELTFVTREPGGRRSKEARYGHSCLHIPVRTVKGYEIWDRWDDGLLMGRALEIKTRSGRILGFPLVGDGKTLEGRIEKVFSGIPKGL